MYPLDTFLRHFSFFHKAVWIKLLCIILGYIKQILSFQITETKTSGVKFITQFLSDSCLLSVTAVSKCCSCSYSMYPKNLLQCEVLIAVNVLWAFCSLLCLWA